VPGVARWQRHVRVNSSGSLAMFFGRRQKKSILEQLYKAVSDNA